MNVYQKVLMKLYEEVGERDSRAVYLKDIVKDLGFLPSYEDIFSQMSHDGWIAETSRTNEVNLTPWGIREARKIKKGGGDNSREVSRGANKIKAEAKELLVMAEELVDEVSESRLKAVENKLDLVSGAVASLKQII